MSSRPRLVGERCPSPARPLLPATVPIATVPASGGTGEGPGPRSPLADADRAAARAGVARRRAFFAGGQNVVFGNIAQEAMRRSRRRALAFRQRRSCTDCTVRAFAEYGSRITPREGVESPVWSELVRAAIGVHWNGSARQCIGWTNDSVDALAEYGGELYAAGSFDREPHGGEVRRSLGRFRVACGPTPECRRQGKVRSLTVHGACSSRAATQALSAPVAQWDGAVDARRSGARPFQCAHGASTANAVVLTGPKLYASGDYHAFGRRHRSRTAVWDGASRASLPNVAGASSDTAVHDGQLVANALDGTSQYLQFWDGSRGMRSVSDGHARRVRVERHDAVRRRTETPTNTGPGVAVHGLSAFESMESLQEAWTPDAEGLLAAAYGIRNFHGELFVGRRVRRRRHRHAVLLQSPARGEMDRDELGGGQLGVSGTGVRVPGRDSVGLG